MTTKLQAELLIKIAESEFTVVNGAVPETLDDVGAVWADIILDSKSEGGVFSTLLQAGLVWYQDEGRDSVCGLTETGFAEYQSIKAAQAA